MKLDLNNLPKDPDLLHRLVKDLVSTVEDQDNQLQSKDDQLQSKDNQLQSHAKQIQTKDKRIQSQAKQIRQFQKQLDDLRRHRYGKRSQKIDPNQLSLWQESLDEDIGETEQAIGRAPKTTTQRGKAKRKPLPKHLPRQTQVYTHDDEHCTCGQPLHRMGTQTCEELQWQPPTFYVTRHEQIKYTCRHCETVITAKKPTRPIEKGIFGASMLAYLLVSKYQDHIPIDRVQRICQRSEIHLPVSTMTDALGRCGWILRPLVERLTEYLLEKSHLHTDDTVIPVIDSARGQTKQGRLWAYVHTGTEGPAAVVFDYTPNRSQQGPQQFLQRYRGYLQADGYPGYQKLYQQGEVVEVACMAHVRAKFEAVEKRMPSPIAQKALAWIGQLYAIEKDIKTKTDDQRLKHRRQKAWPILQQLKTHLETSWEKIAANSDMAEPIQYALKRWQALIRYTEAGRLHIDNNPAERCIRPITIGRKNWNFAGSDMAAERTAMIYSLIETCKLNHVDPMAYLTDVLNRIADHPQKHIDQLLPYHWKPPD